MSNSKDDIFEICLTFLMLELQQDITSDWFSSRFQIKQSVEIIIYFYTISVGQLCWIILPILEKRLQNQSLQQIKSPNLKLRGNFVLLPHGLKQALVGELLPGNPNNCRKLDHRIQQVQALQYVAAMLFFHCHSGIIFSSLCINYFTILVLVSALYTACYFSIQYVVLKSHYCIYEYTN